MVRSTKRGGRPRREESERKGLRILDTAATVFARHGYVGTSIERIAKAANVGKPTIYARYGSKANLLKLVIRHVLDNHLAVMSEHIEQKPLEAGMADLLANIIAASTDRVYLGVFRLFLSEAHKFEEIFEAFQTTMESQTKQRLVHYIDHHPGRTDLIGSSEDVAIILLEYTSSVVMMASTRPGYRETLSAEAEAARIVHIVLHGLLRRD